VPHAENLCGSFWWRDVLKLVENFRGVSMVKHGKGNTFLFWSDNWQISGSDRPLNARFPRLFSFVRNENVSTEFAFGQEDLSSMFHLPLSHAAFTELGQLQQLMHDNPLSSQEDSWTYCWG
jgi:hypothetical protein